MTVTYLPLPPTFADIHSTLLILAKSSAPSLALAKPSAGDPALVRSSAGSP